MEKVVCISFMSDDLRLKNKIPRLFQSIEVSKKDYSEFVESGEDRYYYAFVFPEYSWELWPKFREWIKSIDVSELSESFRCNFNESDERSAALCGLGAQVWYQASTIENNAFDEVNCVECKNVVRKVRPAPSLFIDIPIGDDTPHCFRVRNICSVVSTTLLNALKKADLVTGLSWFPVKIKNAEDGLFWGIYGTENLGRHVAPFGYETGPCQTCGNYLARYNFYHLFQKPERQSHWMYSEEAGPTVLKISNEVWRWLNSEGKKLAFKAPRTYDLEEDPPWVSFYVLGYYPDDGEKAFFPAGCLSL